jgi:hypothetical protein
VPTVQSPDWLKIMTDAEAVNFIVAMPGWDVLYYRDGGGFDASPVIAWAIVPGNDGFVHSYPVTVEPAAYDDTRPLCTPDGNVICSDLEQWDSVWSWLAAMKEREISPRPAAPSPVLALDNFRSKLRPGE